MPILLLLDKGSPTRRDSEMLALSELGQSLAVLTRTQMKNNV